MLKRQLVSRGVRDRRVLAAMAAIPREAFVPPELNDLAYEDRPLPLEAGQSISQPYIVGFMVQEAGINRRTRVLEIGTGSGYQTAILARLAQHIWSVERLPELSRLAAERLRELGIHNCTLVRGDGALGYRPGAPYDAIISTAASPVVPGELLLELAVGGRLVLPVGGREQQDLIVIERLENGFEERRKGPCRFVPLISPEAFEP